MFLFTLDSWICFDTHDNSRRSLLLVLPSIKFCADDMRRNFRSDSTFSEKCSGFVFILNSKSRRWNEWNSRNFILLRTWSSWNSFPRKTSPHEWNDGRARTIMTWPSVLLSNRSLFSMEWINIEMREIFKGIRQMWVSDWQRVWLKSHSYYSHQRFLQHRAMSLIEFSINVNCKTSEENEQTDSDQKYENFTRRLLHHHVNFQCSLEMEGVIFWIWRICKLKHTIDKIEKNKLKVNHHIKRNKHNWLEQSIKFW